MKTPESSTSARRAFSSSSRGAYCAFTSTSGIVGTSSQSRGAATQQERGGPDEDGRDGGVVRIAKVVMEPRVARSDPPADAGDCEAPDRRPDESKRGVAAEPNAEHTSRDRDEGAHDGRQAAEEHSPIAATLEPALRP